METEIEVRAVASPQELLEAQALLAARFLTIQASRWMAIVQSRTVRTIPKRQT